MRTRIRRAWFRFMARRDARIRERKVKEFASVLGAVFCYMDSEAKKASGE